MMFRCVTVGVAQEDADILALKLHIEEWVACAWILLMGGPGQDGGRD